MSTMASVRTQKKWLVVVHYLFSLSCPFCHGFHRSTQRDTTSQVHRSSSWTRSTTLLLDTRPYGDQASD